MGRLKHVDPAYPLPTTPAYTYAYEANSAALVATVTGPVHTVTNTWESTRDALDTKKNADTAGTPSVPSSFNYSVNNLGQRDLVGPMMDGGSPAAPISIHSVAWEWAYNDRGELESADHGDDGTANTKDRFYAFDAIGNRDYVREGVFTDSSGTQVQYTANAPNQYTVANGVTLPTPAFDADGNNTNGPIPVATGNATLEWDAENRLVKVTRADSVVITYAYDYHGRRISKTVGGGTARHYFYEGWNPVAEYAGHTLDKTYLWGMDLSGSIQGAGGVGGLLAVKEGAYHYYPTFDGNGNVGEYLDAAGVSAAHYEYDAFGNTVASSGTKQSDFAHRFSTKFFDSESGFYYYGYRFYDPVTGRWPSRDPIGERGGVNLYGFAGNEGVNAIDKDGRFIWFLVILVIVGVAEAPGIDDAPNPNQPDQDVVVEPTMEEIVDYLDPLVSSGLEEMVEEEKERVLGEHGSLAAAPFIIVNECCKIKKSAKRKAIKLLTNFESLWKRLHQGKSMPKNMSDKLKGLGEEIKSTDLPSGFEWDSHECYDKLPLRDIRNLPEVDD